MGAKKSLNGDPRRGLTKRKKRLGDEREDLYGDIAGGGPQMKRTLEDFRSFKQSVLVCGLSWSRILHLGDVRGIMHGGGETTFVRQNRGREKEKIAFRSTTLRRGLVVIDTVRLGEPISGESLRQQGGGGRVEEVRGIVASSTLAIEASRFDRPDA